MDASGDLSWDEIHRRIVPLMKADGRRNTLAIAGDYTFLAVVLGTAAVAYRSMLAGSISVGLFAAIAGVIIPLVAVGQHRLSGLAHDASHHVLFRNRLVNELVSDLFLMFPIVAMTQTYRASHLGHHRWVNDAEHDPDLIRLKALPFEFPLSKARFWLRYVLKGLWPLAMMPYLFGRAKAANLGGIDEAAYRTVYRKRVARTMRGAYWLSVFTAIHALHAWPLFFLFWVAPLLTVYPGLMQLREIAHHSNAPDDGDLTNSRVFRVNAVIRWAVFPYGQSFHLTHHLFALVPHHRLPEVHKLLMRNADYRRDVIVCQGYFFRTPGTAGPSILDVLSHKPEPTIYRGPIVEKHRDGARVRD